MRISVPREIAPAERRAAATPDSVKKLIKLGFEVAVEAGIGVEASLPDADYTAAGASVMDDTKALWAQADIVLKVQPPLQHEGLGVHEADLLPEGATIVCFVQADLNPDVPEKLAARKATVLAVEQVPRISRAQKMDVLSSMANVAGYRAIIEAAHAFGSFFTGQFTAAGKVPPGKVLVIGAGVAGLAAAGAARGLGAIVRAFDTRSAVRDQVTSMGAEFLEVEIEEEGETAGGYSKVMSQAFIDAEMAMFREQAKDVDIVVTTALIQGRKAPILWTTDMVESMKEGSVVVDMAAIKGGNCELTQNGEHVVHNGVHVIGHSDLSTRMPTTASNLYSMNLVHMLDEFGGAEGWNLDLTNEIARGMVLYIDGVEPVLPELPEKAEKPKPAPKPAPEPAKVEEVAARPPAVKDVKPPPKGGWISAILGLALIVPWLYYKLADPGGLANPSTAVAFLQHMTVFVLSIIIGWHVVWSVTPALHTPLMSVTNAISGIIVLGGIVVVDKTDQPLVFWLGIGAILLATINIAGGFLVTQRMLKMFHR